MTDTITFDLGSDSKLTVTAHDTETPGLIVYSLLPFSSRYRLAHSSGFAIGDFADFEEAQAAAAALAGATDWTCTSDELRAIDDTVIWQAIDAVESAGGEFTCTRGGRGEAVAEARRKYLAEQDPAA